MIEEEFGSPLLDVVLSGCFVLLEESVGISGVGGGGIGGVFLVMMRLLGEVELDGLEVLDGCLEGGQIIGG